MSNRLSVLLIAGIATAALAWLPSGDPRARTAAAQEDTPGSLTVLTVNGDDEPVPGACYDLFVDENGPTDFVAEQCDAYDGATDGLTVFAEIPPGDYVLVQIFVPAGYKTGKVRSLAVLAGEAADYAFRTPRGGRAVTLTLRDENEQPLPGGCFSLYPAENGGQPGPALKVACDFYDAADDGTTTIAGLDQGAYDVILSSPPEGYTIPTGQRIDVGGDDLALVFDIALGGETVTIANVDASGEPVPGSCYRLYTDAGDGARGDLIAAACDPADGANDGSIAIVGLLPGAYLLATPAAPADIPFEVIAGAGAEVEVVSPPIEDETGTPAP